MRPALATRGSRPGRATVLGLLIAAALLAHATTALAHGMRSAYLEIDEVAGGSPLVRLRVTQADAIATPQLQRCQLTPLPGTHEDQDGVTRAYRASCQGELIGTRITVSGLGVDLEEAVVRVVTATGQVHAAVLTAAEPSFVVPARADASAALTRYLAAGLRHILGGLDHLLFLLLVVLHLRRLRPILVAETAFSLSHGLAFALTATGVVRVPAAPVEAAIALSLVLLALDTGRASGPSPRATAWLALGFGAVHGLGFAGGLRELGVPDSQVAPAILGFGLGVELGQLAFVLLGWAALAALARLTRRPPPSLTGSPATAPAAALRWTGVRLQQALVLAAGALAMSWLLQRSALALLGT